LCPKCATIASMLVVRRDFAIAWIVVFIATSHNLVAQDFRLGPVDVTTSGTGELQIRRGEQVLHVDLSRLIRKKIAQYWPKSTKSALVARQRLVRTVPDASRSLLGTTIIRSSTLPSAPGNQRTIHGPFLVMPGPRKRSGASRTCGLLLSEEVRYRAQAATWHIETSLTAAIV
jgi:hypothetical protein